MFASRNEERWERIECPSSTLDSAGSVMNARLRTGYMPAFAPTKDFRSAVYAGGFTALLFFLIFAKGATPLSVIDLLSSDTITELSVHGGSRVELSIAHGKAGQETTEEVAGMMKAGGAFVTQAQNSKIILELLEFDVADAKAWAQRMTSGGQLSMQLVIEDSECMASAYALGLAEGEALGVTAEIDQWSHVESGTKYRDYYFLADTREILETAVKHWQESGELVLPSNTMLGYEEIHSQQDYDSPTEWRTYLLNSTKELTNKEIESASVYWDELSYKPEVLFSFTNVGRESFADLTAANVGKKIAILVGDTINSAPTIQAPILGGRSAISMGGSNAKTMQAEAQALVALFTNEELPAEVDIVSVEAVKADVANSQLLIARLLMAFVAGLCTAILTFLLAMLLNRVAPRKSSARDVAPEPEPGQWFASLRPLLLSLSGIAAVIVLGTFWLPGTEELFGDVLFNGDGTAASASRQVSWVALGLTPFMGGAVIAETIAFLIPAWRKRRGGDKTTRAPIETLSLALGLILLSVQAVIISSWLGSFDPALYNADSLSQPEYNGSAVLMALLGGSALLYIIAKLINRYGVGNGYALVLFAGTLPLVPEFLKQGGVLSTLNVFAFCKAFMFVALALVVSTSLLTRVFHIRTGRFALPLPGVAPLLIGPWLLGIILIVLRNEQYEESLLLTAEFIRNLQLIGVAVASILITVFALRRSSSEIRVVAGAKSTGDTRSLAITILISLAFPLGLYYLLYSMAEVRWIVIPLSTLVFAPAFVLDFWREFWARFRNPQLVPVWDLQKPHSLLPLTEALENAEIEFFVQARYFRTLLSVVGPFVPMVIMVPEEKSAEARELIEGLLAH